MRYLRETLMRPRVVLSVAIVAASQLIWPYLMIGLPVIFFGLDGGGVFQLVFLIVFFVPLLSLYLIVCFIIFRIRLIGNEKLKAEFVDLSEKEKGKLIGDLL